MEAREICLSHRLCKISAATPLHHGHCVLTLDLYQEELNRLDIFQKFFLVARGDMPCCLPADPEGRPKILDLGTGTGIWAIHVAEL